MTRKFRTVGRSRPQLFRSRSRFLYPFSLLLPFVVSVFVLSVSEVSVSHCIIAKSCLRRFMLGQSVRASVICLLCSKHVTSLFPFSVTGRGMFRSLIVTLFCNFMISNLSWNTNDETLRQVRLILFCCFLSVVRVPDDLVFCVSPLLPTLAVIRLFQLMARSSMYASHLFYSKKPFVVFWGS